MLAARIKQSIIYLVFIACIALLLLLGFWQLDRAHQKQQYLQAYQQNQQLPPLPLAQVPQDYTSARFQRISVSGSWDNQHQFFLENQRYQKQEGYFVITPLRIQGSNAVVLVNRGWVPLGAQRSQLPALPPVSSQAAIVGLLQLYPSKHFVLKELDDPHWPSRVQKLDPAQLAEKLNTSIYPYYLLLLPDQQQGFVRDWQITVTGPEKHWGYAFQWFALAATLFIIGVLILRKKRQQRKRLS